MNKHHKYLLAEIKRNAGSKPAGFDLDKYSGAKRKRYHVRTSIRRKIAKSWANRNEEISVGDLIEVVGSMYQGESSDEKYLASHLLEYLPKQRVKINPKLLDKWLNNLEGWAEIDGLCSQCFSADDMLSNWNAWKTLLKKIVNDKNTNKRRSSLVLLVKPVRQNGDKRLSKQAFDTIDRLKGEDSILITKAVSWLLRSLITHHRGSVASYIHTHEEYLPKIAVRETKRKLETGKK